MFNVDAMRQGHIVRVKKPLRSAVGGTAGPVAHSQVMVKGPHGEKGPVITGHARKGPVSSEHAQKGQAMPAVKTTCPVCARSCTTKNLSVDIENCSCSANENGDIATDTCVMQYVALPMDIGDNITAARSDL